jgi:hypothetical protein
MNFREAMVLRAFAVWTVYVWVTRIGTVLGDHQHGHGLAFKAIHIALAIISVAFAALCFWIVRNVRRRDKHASAAPTTAD